uniref:Novel immune-type receptor 10a n=1 Tax=Cyprinus carpio TaxID=7962 RepID=A0A8C2FX05_CYPCA
MFSTASIQTHPGQSVTMWCSHNIHVSGNLFWFKQSDGAVPITIVHMLYTESRQKVEPNYFNNFRKDHLVMDQFSKFTTLTIKKVNISDSGFYFCGATGYHMKFGNGTRLEVKAKCGMNIIKIALDIIFKSLIIFRATDCLFLCFVPVAECQAQQHDDKVNHTDFTIDMKTSKTLFYTRLHFLFLS